MPIPWSKKEGLKATCAVLIFALRLPPEHRWVWNTVGPDISLSNFRSGEAVLP